MVNSLLETNLEMTTSARTEISQQCGQHANKNEPVGSHTKHFKDDFYLQLSTAAKAL